MLKEIYLPSAILLLSLVLPANSGRAQSSRPSVPAHVRQLVVVTTAGWDAVGGKLQRYERAKAGVPWRAVGEPLDVVVGRSGLGWGRELETANLPGPVKREGDGRAPAGLYSLSRAFGYDRPAPSEKISLPYLVLTSEVECVDDAGSSLYNRIVRRGEVSRVDWKSSEEMRRTDDLYRRGIIVDYNTRRPARGRGSCIFLHLWSGPGVGTAGCTAMRETDLATLLAWLRKDRHPHLAQLPLAEYDRLKKAWRLPG